MGKMEIAKITIKTHIQVDFKDSNVTFYHLKVTIWNINFIEVITSGRVICLKVYKIRQD